MTDNYYYENVVPEQRNSDLDSRREIENVKKMQGNNFKILLSVLIVLVVIVVAVLGLLVYFIFMGTNDREMAERIYQTVRIRVCPNNGFYSDDICYFTHDDLMNWNEAQNVCYYKSLNYYYNMSRIKKKWVSGKFGQNQVYLHFL